MNNIWQQVVTEFRTHIPLKMKKITSVLLITLVFTTTVLSNCKGYKPTVKIAIVAPFSGMYREIGYQVLNGARIAVNEYNDSNTALTGIELIAFDDAGNPTQAQEQANKLITDKKVLVVIGHWLDKTTTAAAPIYMNANLPLLSTSAKPSNPNNTWSTFFRLHPTTEQITAEIERAQKIYSIFSGCNCDPYEGADFLDNLQKQNQNNVAIGGPLWSLQTFNDIARHKSEASFFVVPVAEPMLENISSQFIKQYKTAYPEGPDPSWFSLHAYESINLIVNTIQSTETLTSKSFAQTLSEIDYHGLIGRVQFDSDGKWIMPQLKVYKWDNSTKSLP